MHQEIAKFVGDRKTIFLRGSYSASATNLGAVLTPLKSILGEQNCVLNIVAEDVLTQNILDTGIPCVCYQIGDKPALTIPDSSLRIDFIPYAQSLLSLAPLEGDQATANALRQAAWGLQHAALMENSNHFLFLPLDWPSLADLVRVLALYIPRPWQTAAEFDQKKKLVLLGWHYIQEESLAAIKVVLGAPQIKDNQFKIGEVAKAIAYLLE